MKKEQVCRLGMDGPDWNRGEPICLDNSRFLIYLKKGKNNILEEVPRATKKYSSSHAKKSTLPPVQSFCCF